MKTPTTPRTPKGRRAVVIGALSVLTLGGFGAAFATSAAAATPAPAPAPVSATTAPTTAPATESTTAKDTDTLQQGDQTGPDTTVADTTNDGESATK